MNTLDDLLAYGIRTCLEYDNKYYIWLDDGTDNSTVMWVVDKETRKARESYFTEATLVIGNNDAKRITDFSVLKEAS